MPRAIGRKWRISTRSPWLTNDRSPIINGNAMAPTTPPNIPAKIDPITKMNNPPIAPEAVPQASPIRDKAAIRFGKRSLEELSIADATNLRDAKPAKPVAMPATARRERNNADICQPDAVSPTSFSKSANGGNVPINKPKYPMDSFESIGDVRRETLIRSRSVGYNCLSRAISAFNRRSRASRCSTMPPSSRSAERMLLSSDGLSVSSPILHPIVLSGHVNS